LLAQDLIVIPMLIILGLLGSKTPSWSLLGTQIGGAIAIIATKTGRSPGRQGIFNSVI